MAILTRIHFGLRDAAYSLDEQAAGRTPELSRLLSGTITLDTLFRRRALDPDLQDAALSLERIVRQSAFKFDEQERTRAAELAEKMRILADSYCERRRLIGDREPLVTQNP